MSDKNLFNLKNNLLGKIVILSILFIFIALSVVVLGFEVAEKKASAYTVNDFPIDSRPNLLFNSDFSKNSNGQTSYTGNIVGLDSWKGLRSTTIISTVINGVNIVGTSKEDGFRQDILDSSLSIAGNAITASINITAITGTVRLWVRNNVNWTTTYAAVNISTPGNFSCTGSIPSGVSNSQLCFYIDFASSASSNNSVTIQNVKLEFGSSASSWTPNLSELYTSAYDIGYDTGYVLGESDGYEAGYDFGEADGYDYGYDNGYAVGNVESFQNGTIYGFKNTFTTYLNTFFDTNYSIPYLFAYINDRTGALYLANLGYNNVLYRGNYLLIYIDYLTETNKKLYCSTNYGFNYMGVDDSFGFGEDVLPDTFAFLPIIYNVEFPSNNTLPGSGGGGGVQQAAPLAMSAPEEFTLTDGGLSLGIVWDNVFQPLNIYDTAYAYGETGGYEVGYIEGHDNGRADGYVDGYSQGNTAATLAWDNLMPSFLGSIASFYVILLGGIELFGTNMLTLLGTIGVFLVVFAIINKLRG